MLLKDIFSLDFYDQFSNELEVVLPALNKAEFIRAIFANGWEAKELKQRMRHTSTVLHSFLPASFPEASELIRNLIKFYQQQGKREQVLEYCFLPDYIEQYGIDDYDNAIPTFERVTQLTSCEFAVRPFIIKYGDPMIQQMVAWSKHENVHVRRLSSEGIRPRLPWAMGLPKLKENPEPIVPILENLKNDPSEMVRRSVANNLNDISKDHPALLLHLAKKWKGLGKETDDIIRHASRTLLKQGHREILQLFDLAANKALEISGFKLGTPIVKTGADCFFTFTIQNRGKHPLQVRVEYAMYFLRQNGSHSKKVFMISERLYQPGETATISRKHSFKPITTRRYYPGLHRLSLILNGEEQGLETFELAG